MYFYSSEISGMPECTLSLIMRKQSHNSKLRDILIGMDFSKIFTSWKNFFKGRRSVKGDYKDMTLKAISDWTLDWKKKAVKDIIKTNGKIWFNDIKFPEYDDCILIT